MYFVEIPGSEGQGKARKRNGKTRLQRFETADAEKLNGRKKAENGNKSPYLSRFFSLNFDISEAFALSVIAI